MNAKKKKLSKQDYEMLGEGTMIGSMMFGLMTVILGITKMNIITKVISMTISTVASACFGVLLGLIGAIACDDEEE